MSYSSFPSTGRKSRDLGWYDPRAISMNQDDEFPTVNLNKWQTE